MKENNTIHDSDDAAIVSMEIHTLMNWTQIRVDFYCIHCRIVLTAKYV